MASKSRASYQSCVQHSNCCPRKRLRKVSWLQYRQLMIRAGCNVNNNSRLLAKKKSQEGQGVISAAIWHQKDKVSLSHLVQDSSLQVSQKSNLQIIQNHAHSCVIFLTFCQRRSTIQQVVPNNRVSFISYLLENLFSSWLRKISNYSLEKTNTEIHLTFDRLDTVISTSACKVKMLVAQLCPTLCDAMDCSPPGFSVMEFSRQEY